MSSTTPNLGLTKTTAAETIGQNWAASNESGGNFDIIDTKMGAVGSQSVQAQLDALNSKLTPTYATVTLASGITGTVMIMRMGKLRVLTGYFNPNTSGANITIATLDAQDKPPVNIQGNFSGYGVTATGELNISSAGTFQCSVNATPSNTLKFNIAYAVS